MADKKLSELTSITSADIASGDLLLVSDVSAGISKSITYGELTTITTGDLNFADNAKAIFGAGNDLQIYHSGTDSYIVDSGVGDLRIQANQFKVMNAAGTLNGLTYDPATGVTALYNIGNEKLATTATGVDVTGTLVSDGLTVDGTGTINTSGTGIINYNYIGANKGSVTTDGISIFQNAASNMYFNVNSANRMLIEGTGDISFYEDTGTTPKLFWDASAEALGIGTTSPQSTTSIHIVGSNGASGANANVAANELFVDNNGDSGVTIGTANTGTGYYAFADSDVALRGGLFYDHSSDDMGFRVASSTAMTIDSSNNVGIGTSSPTNHNSSSRVLHHDGGALTRSEIRLTNATTGTAAGNGLLFATVGNDSYIYQLEAAPMIFGTSGSEVARLDASGNLLVGTTDNTLYNNTTGGGFKAGGDNRVDMARQGDIVAIMNRTGNSNGTILEFRKDGSPVGSIGTIGGDVYFTSSGANAGIRSYDAANALSPVTNTGGLSDGNVNLGWTDSRFKDLYLSSAIYITGSGDKSLTMTSGTGSVSLINMGDADDIDIGQIAYDNANNSMQFKANATERMRLGADGAVYIGTTTLPANGSGGSAFRADTNGRRNLYLSTTATNNQGLIVFDNPNGEVGSVTVNGSATSFNTSSDYRLKENVVDLTGATDRLKQIPVHRFNFIADPDKTVDGFLAHEVQNIVPEAITGTKDEIDDEGNPVYQGIDQSKLVPLLTAALQEALTKIDDLEARIQTLEGN